MSETRKNFLLNMGQVTLVLSLVLFAIFEGYSVFGYILSNSFYDAYSFIGGILIDYLYFLVFGYFIILNLKIFNFSKLNLLKLGMSIVAYSAFLKVIYGVFNSILTSYIDLIIVQILSLRLVMHMVACIATAYCIRLIIKSGIVSIPSNNINAINKISYAAITIVIFYELLWILQPYYLDSFFLTTLLFIGVVCALFMALVAALNVSKSAQISLVRLVIVNIVSYSIALAAISGFLLITSKNIRDFTGVYPLIGLCVFILIIHWLLAKLFCGQPIAKNRPTVAEPQ